jgi:hypothetical protein
MERRKMLDGEIIGREMLRIDCEFGGLSPDTIDG